MDAQNYTNLCPKVFDFCQILKVREKTLLNLQTFLLLLFYIVQREDAHR